jgi:hypothetical protein
MIRRTKAFRKSKYQPIKLSHQAARIGIIAIASSAWVARAPIVATASGYGSIITPSRTISILARRIHGLKEATWSVRNSGALGKSRA